MYLMYQVVIDQAARGRYLIPPVRYGGSYSDALRPLENKAERWGGGVRFEWALGVSLGRVRVLGGVITVAAQAIQA